MTTHSHTPQPDYEVTKTVRFLLRPVSGHEQLRPEATSGGADIDVLSVQCAEILSAFQDIFLDNQKIEHTEHKETGQKWYTQVVFQKRYKVRYGWLRSYTKTDFYTWRNTLSDTERKSKNYALTEVGYLPDVFLVWLNEWERVLAQLRALLAEPDETQRRRRDFAQLLRMLQNRDSFEFIAEFIYAVLETQEPKLDDKVQVLRALIADTQKNLKHCEQAYLPSQSRGLRVARASFNYYTLNKTPKEYGNLIKTKEQEFEREVSHRIFRREEKVRGKYVTIFNCTQAWFSQIGLTDISRFSVSEAYDTIKVWKAEQKTKFIEGVQKMTVKTIQDVEKKFPLFTSTPAHLNEFVLLTAQIVKCADEKKKLLEKVDKNKEDEEKIQYLRNTFKSLREKRGAFFNKPGSGVRTKNYYELCELYKRIATKLGNILAEIKAMESEKVDSQLLRYWAVLYNEYDKHFLMLVPRRGGGAHKKAREYLLREVKCCDTSGEVKLYQFESLKFRALWKLCFQETGNTFFPDVARELGIDMRESMKFGLQHKQPVRFYQKVLKTEKARHALRLTDFGGLNEVLTNEYDDVDAFAVDLERKCYVRIPHTLTKEKLQHAVDTFHASVFEIDSYDLRIEYEKRSDVCDTHVPKQHTTLWKSFWVSENEQTSFPIRLNPEVSIIYREARSDFKASEEKVSNLNTDVVTGMKYRNRHLSEQFTLATTITTNAPGDKSDLSFKTLKDVQAYVDRFNIGFDARWDGEWYYGIDRGRKELATLCVMKEGTDTYTVDGNTFPKPIFAPIKVYALKKDVPEIAPDKKGVERNVRKNISYFVEKNEWFEEKTVSCIDLTTAKVIHGKIILNGDCQTYLSLKERNARRRIFDLFSRGKITQASPIIDRGKNLTVENDEVLYYFTPEQAGNVALKKEIQDVLKKYLLQLSANNAVEDIESVQKINNLRDAITANMIGVIYFLQTIYPGRIGLENLGQEEHDRHLVQSNENVSRRLEWALYRKLQTSSFVPPNIKQSILVRKECRVMQFGIVQYIDPENTSKICPRCGNIYKKTRGHYMCEKTSCGFSSRDNRLEFDSLDDSDKVAAYNVARRVLDLV